MTKFKSFKGFWPLCQEKTKFDLWAHQFIFIGYLEGKTTYKLHDLQTNKVFTSHNKNVGIDQKETHRSHERLLSRMIT